jgi:hypothetical protein
MRIARVARYSLLGILSLLILVVVLLFTLDLGRFKGKAESLISDVLQREFSIGGEFQLELGRDIYIVAEDIRLADADWSSDEPMASVGRFEATIDMWSLFDSPILIESVHIENTSVHLRSNATGDHNWEFFPADDDDEAEPEESDKRPTLPVMLIEAAIIDLALDYDDPQRPRPIEFVASEFRATQTEADELDVTLSSTLNDTLLELTANAGTVENLIDYSDVEFDIALQLGEIHLNTEATIGDLLQPRRPTARLVLQGPNAEYLTNVLRLQQITTGPLDLTATIAPVGEKMQVVVNGDFGEFTLDATGGFVNLQELQDLELRVAAGGPDASAVARLFGNDGVPPDPFSIIGDLQQSGDSLAVESIKVTIGKSQFDIAGRFDSFPNPRGAHASLRVGGPDFGRFNKLLGLPGKLTGPFNIDADLTPLAEGGASVVLNATAQDLQFSIVGDVSDKPDFAGTNVEVTVAGPNLQTVATAAGLATAPRDPFELRVVVNRVATGAAIETGTLSIGDLQFSLQGLVGNKPLEADTDVQFELSGPDLAKTLASFGRDADELPSARYRASGRIERGPDYFMLHDIVAEIGADLQYQLTADGQLSLEPNLEGTRIRMTATGTSLGALTDAAGIEGIPDEPFKVGATVERMANGISVQDGSIDFGGDHINVHGLIGDKPLERDTSIQFDVRAPDLKATLAGFGIDVATLPAGGLDLAGELRHQGSGFVVRNLTASLAGAAIRLDGRLGAFPGLEGTKLTVRVEGADLSRLLPDDENFSALNKPYGLSAVVALRDSDLSLEDVEISVGEARLEAEAELALSPFFDHGSFSIDATAPDMFQLVPALGKISDHERAPLEWHTVGNWADNLWTLDNFLLQLGKGTITANGTVDGPPAFNRTNLRLDWNISSIRNYSILAGRDLPDEPARLKLRLVGSDNTIAFEEFSGIFGDSDITGDFSFRHGDVPEVHARFRSDRLNLAPYLPEPSDESEPAAEETPAAGDARVIPDIALPVDQLRKYAATVDIRIAEMVLRQRTLSNLVLRGALEDGALLINEFNIKSPRDENLAGSFELHEAGSGAEILMAVQGTSLKFGLPSASVEELKALPKYDLDTVLHGTGTTLRELAASLDGYLRLVAGPGRLRLTGLQFLAGDFLSQVIGSINPFTKTDPYTNFECGVILLQFEDGVVSGQPGVVTQSERLRVFANTEIDLGSEDLDVTINTVARKGVGISFSNLINPYTKIGGTLASPSLQLDPEGAMIEGGAAIATGGLSILAKGFKDRFLSAKDPCGKALGDADPTYQAIKKAYFPESTTAQ